MLEGSWQKAERRRGWGRAWSKASRSSTMRVRDAMLGMVVTITLSPKRSSSCGRSSPSCTRCTTFFLTLASEKASHYWNPISSKITKCSF